MRAYYYLLFRLYTTLSKPEKQNDEKTIIYLTVSTSTFIIYFSIIFVLSIFDYIYPVFFDILVPKKYFVIIYMLVIGLLNYWFFIRNKKFLRFNFKNDKKGGYAIILYIFVLGMVLVFFANKNREKIFKEREKTRIENTQ